MDKCILSQTNPVFTSLQYKSFENTVGKGETACNEQFLLFPQCFLPVGELSAILTEFEIVVCKLFLLGRVQNFSFGTGLKYDEDSTAHYTCTNRTFKFFPLWKFQKIAWIQSICVTTTLTAPARNPTSHGQKPTVPRDADSVVSLSSLTLSQTTNFRLPNWKIWRQQFQTLWKWQKMCQTGRKDWEKEKLLVTSNFSFFHSVFKSIVLWCRHVKTRACLGKG